MAPNDHPDAHGRRRPRAAWLRLCVVVLAWVCFGSSTWVHAAAPVPDEVLDEVRTNTASPTHVPEREAAVDAVSVRLTIWRGRGEQPKAGWEGERPDRYAARVDGTASYHIDASVLDNPQELLLLDYASAMDREPKELDSLTFAAYQGGPWSHSSTRVIEAVDQRGEPLSTRRVGDGNQIRVQLTPGVEVVHLRYRVQVPRRYWPFGCVKNRCALGGGLAPLPSEAAEGGLYLPEHGRVVRPAVWSVESVRFGDLPDWVPGTDPSPEEEKGLRGDEIVVTRDNSMGSTRHGYPGVFWGRSWKRHRFVYQGVDVWVLHMDRRPAAEYPHETKLQYRADVAGNLDAIAREVIDAAQALGLRQPPDTTLTLVQGPLRSEVSQAHPSAVLVSDEYLNVLPAKPARRFHHEQVARAILDHLSLGYFTPGHDASERLWVAGSVAYGLMRVWQALRNLPDEDARDLLRNLSFMPAVDSFLYRGQASFASAYFRGSEDVFPVRNHPLWFSHQLPTGRRIYAKLADYMSPETLSQLMSGLVAEPRGDPIELAERTWGRELGWFFDQWLGPYPDTDYAVLDMQSERLPDGRFHTRIRVGRDSELPLVEPLQVLAVEKPGKRKGRRHYLVWSGEPEPGKALSEQPRSVEKTFELVTERSIAYVLLDPRFHNQETSRIPSSRGGRPDNNDPRFNNRRPGNRRFIYTGIGVNVAASEFLAAETAVARINSIAGFFQFEAGLRRDLRYSGTFQVFKDRETLVGAGASFNAFFLEKTNGQRRRLRLRNSISTSWLGTRGLDPVGGVRVQEAISLTDDTRRFAFWPDAGHRATLGIRLSQVFRTTGDRSDDRHDFTVFAEHTQLFRLAHDHVLAARVSGELVAPLVNELEYRALPRLGGVYGLSGFLADEEFGRGVLRAQVEYRHIFVNDLRINFANFAWVRSLGGALFSGVGTQTNCSSYDGMFTRESWRGQVGYGLMAYVHYLGVAPQLIRLEAAVPLGRSRTACLGQVFPDALAEAQGLDGDEARSLLPPFNINLLFNHPF